MEETSWSPWGLLAERMRDASIRRPERSQGSPAIDPCRLSFEKFIVNLIDAIATTPKSIVTFAWQGRDSISRIPNEISRVHSQSRAHQLMELGTHEYRFQNVLFM